MTPDESRSKARDETIKQNELKCYRTLKCKYESAVHLQRNPGALFANPVAISIITS